MIRSMTGFGQGAVNGQTFSVTVDLRSVNNRNLDIHWRAPAELASLEIVLKKRIQARLSRGRVDINISFSQTGTVEYELNRALIRGYLDALRTMRDEFGLVGEPDLSTVARLPNVLQPKAAQGLAEEVVLGIEEALSVALNRLVAMREVEGEELQRELLLRVSRIETHLAVIEANEAGVVDAYREKLRKRVGELLDRTVLDETRLTQEVAYLAERSDITEEMARLRSHLTQLRDLLLNETGTEIGKKLDFLLQETNREANTVLSKSAELAICDAAIAIKTEVEKLREQALNVE
ncbi:MAG: YicC/YloC family endoribonuclease [Blastocatellia bacterium]